MNIKLFSLLILLFFEFLNFCYSITIEFIASVYDVGDDFQEVIVSGFNRYSKEHNLDIEIHRTSLSSLNSTKHVNDYAAFIEAKLKKKNKDIDIIFIDNIYANRFVDHVADLSKYLSKDIIDSYSTGIAPKIGYVGEKLVTMPIFIDVGVLFSNKELLDKYDRKPPKTWDELIETADYINKREKEKGNTDMFKYFAGYSNNELATCSTVELLYSFRDTIDSDIPNFKSNNALRALEKAKEIKEKISSDEEFRLPETELFNVVFQGNTLFFRFFYLPFEFMFYVTPLPGEKEGISASCTGGQSIIINNNISEEKKIAAGKIIDYFLSNESQKNYTLNNGKFSALKEMYYDDEVCSKIDCNLFRNLQLVSRPIHVWRNYDEYSIKLRNYMFDYLFGDITAKETLQKMDNIAFISSIDYSSDIGSVVIIITAILIILIISSIGIIFNKKYQYYLIMYNKTSWFIMLLGLCILISTNFTLLGQINDFKCVSHILIPIFGMSLFVYPTLIYEIIHFPETNKYSEIVKKYKEYIILGLIAIDVLYGILIYSISPYQAKPVYIEEEKNFNTCIIESKPYLVLFIIMYVFKFLVTFAIAVLTFTEYNTGKIYNEMRTITIYFYCNALLIILFIGINIFSSNHFYIQYILKIATVSTITFINYICIIWVRMYYEKSSNTGDEFNLKKNRHGASSSLSNSQMSVSNNPKITIISKIISYHNNTNSSNDNTLAKSGDKVFSSNYSTSQDFRSTSRLNN